MKKLFVVLSLFVAFLATGCARNISVLDEAYKEGEGETKIYNVDFTTAKKIAIEVLKKEGFDAIQDEGNIIKTSSRLTFFLVAFIEIDKNKTEVKAISKRRYFDGLFTTLSESGFFSSFDEKVQKVKK